MSLLSGLLDHMPPAIAGVDSPKVDSQPRPRLVLASSVERTPQLITNPHASAATATPEWRHARDQYLNHIMVCRSCSRQRPPLHGWRPPACQLRRHTYGGAPMTPSLITRLCNIGMKPGISAATQLITTRRICRAIADQLDVIRGERRALAGKRES